MRSIKISSLLFGKLNTSCIDGIYNAFIKEIINSEIINHAKYVTNKI